MEQLAIALEGGDGVGKTTVAKMTRAKYPTLAVMDRSPLTKMTNIPYVNLPEEPPRVDKEGRRMVYIVVDMAADLARQRIMARFKADGVPLDPWEEPRWLHFYRHVYRMVAAKYGLYLITGSSSEEIFKIVCEIVESEVKRQTHKAYAVPRVDYLTKEEVASMPVIVEGQSKIVRAFKETPLYHLVEYKPTVYSHTNQTAGVVEGTDIERMRMTAATMAVFWMNEIDHAYLYVGKKYILTRALTNTFNCPEGQAPDITDIECIVKNMYGGTDKHRYWALQDRKTRRGEPAATQVYGGAYWKYRIPHFRPDLRNPNHVFKLPPTDAEVASQLGVKEEVAKVFRARLHWKRGEDCPTADELVPLLGVSKAEAERILDAATKAYKKPWGDYNLTKSLADEFIDFDASEKLCLRVNELMTNLFEPMGLIFLDFCLMVTSDGNTIYGEFSQDCTRVDRIENGVPLSLTKDVWRAGGSTPNKSLLVTRYREMSDFIESAVTELLRKEINILFPPK